MKPDGEETNKLMSCFAFYGSVASIGDRRYIYTGGKPTIHSNQSSKQAIFVSLSTDCREVSIKKLADMQVGRSSHSMVYDHSRKLVFVVGGFENGKFFKTCEGYNLNNGNWIKMTDLNV